MKWLTWGVVAAMAMLVAGCSGGGSNPAPANTLDGAFTATPAASSTARLA